MGLVVKIENDTPKTDAVRTLVRQLRSSYAGIEYRVVVEVWTPEDWSEGGFAVSVNDDGLTMMAYFAADGTLEGDWF